MVGWYVREINQGDKEDVVQDVGEDRSKLIEPEVN
jgi:hypothetical protein